MGNMLFIVNPRSGKARIKNQLLGIVDLFIKYGWDVQLYITQDQGDAIETARKKGGQMDMIVCSGGDGTLSETISGMMYMEHPPILGYIPSGSTNDFAASLGIPSQAGKAAEIVVTGEARPIDIGYFCQERTFVYVAGFGVFTEVSYMTPQEKKNLLGHQAYMLEGVKSLANIKSYRMRIEADDFCMEGDFIFGMVTNTISVGGFKGLVTQDVALDDGVFEVLMIRTPKTPLELTNILSYMILKEEQSEYVHKFKTSRLRIFSEEEVDWVLDGEFGGARREVEIENLTQRIKIVTGLVKKR
ncbi:MAG: YegS/Rv2252/BmrU family lipid kinase [Hungatella sp.]|nr:YegS/Rv2252/BmrU family lipid kinase [Hungatella sp.]